MRRKMAVCGAFLVLGACGGSGDGEGTSVTEGSVGKSAAAASDTTLAGDAAPTEVSAETPTEASVAAPVAASGGTGGTCAVSTTGGLTVSFAGTGGMNAVNSAHWFTAEELQKAKTDFGFDTPALVLNCAGPNGELLTLSKGTADAFPFAPGSVAFEMNEISVTTNGGAGAYLKPDVAATVTITAFDDQHIAGSATFTAKDIIEPAAAATTIELTFDFENPNP